jgi:hypothetical protein
MFSNDKKPGGVSNWFFSLRRQPKKQKSLDSSKLLQKSCVDLSAAGVAASSSEQELFFRPTVTKPSKLKLNSSNNNNDDTSASNSCTNCCCSFASKTSSPSFGVSPMIDDDEIEQTDQLRKVLLRSEESYSAAGHQINNNNNEQKSPNNFSSNILLYNKKEEFTRTTRTITTRITSKSSSTIVRNGSMSPTLALSNRNLHHRIGLAFNENGQLLNRKQLMNVKNRDGLIFDERGRLISSDNTDETVPLTPASSTIIDDSTIEFIDSSTQNSDIYNRANMQHYKCSCNGGSKSTLTNSSSLLSNTKSDWSNSCNRQVIIAKDQTTNGGAKK